jgi:DNA-binding SARP family transcriptional activator/tetratricopeptide (TPR) repeat protein
MVVEIRLLGGFEVRVDGVPVPDDAWRRRHASALVKLLALAHGASLHREQVIDALWPDLAVAEAAPRLHKAAHFARRAIGHGAVVLRGEIVALAADQPPIVDLHEFVVEAEQALAAGDTASAQRALERWSGPLLPSDPYEAWVEAPREHAAALHRRLLRQAGRWEALVALDPTDEDAQVALMRSLADAGDHRAAFRQFERLDRALRHELGVGPGPAAIAVRDELLTVGPAPPTGRVDRRRSAAGRVVGRDDELAAFDAQLESAATGRARAVFVAGPAGIGKTAFLEVAAVRAARAGWRVGHGAAAVIEGAWPYAPVLEALRDLCRAHPALLDGLDDTLRTEIEQAMGGEDLAWTGDAAHRRLFVAAGELVRLAASSTGALLVVDDLHDADDATLRLVHHLVRANARSRLVVAAGHRTPAGQALEAVRSSLVGRGAAGEVVLGPLSREAITEIVAGASGSDRTSAAAWSLSGGVPWLALEAARAGGAGPEDLPPVLRSVLERVAVSGVAFDTDVFVALSGVDELEAFALLDAALASGVVEIDTAGGGYRFRHGLVRDALLGSVPEHRRRTIHRDAAARLAGLDASPARVGHHLLAAGEQVAAVPYLLRAAETEAAIGAHRDALALVEQARVAARGANRARALALRAELLGALGDARALQAYREAIGAAGDAERRVLRAGLARTAILSGDLDGARAALAGLELDGGPADTPILLSRGILAYLSGDLEAATAASEEARARLTHGDVSWHVLDLVALQGLLAHHRGEWFERLRLELRRTSDEPDLARAVFDGHLCVAEYLLYGPTPYAEVIDLALGLKRSAARSGALRAEAFASALAGEAALLSGDLDAAEAHLQEAVDLHREVAAAAGESHSLQRLAEVHLARGDREEAETLLHRALHLARWSSLALHLVQRIYGSLILAAPDPASARAVVDRAAAETGNDDACTFCRIMLDVPAAIACADVGDLEEAREHLAAAERSASLWAGTAWQASVLEAAAHVEAASGRAAEAASRLDRAARTFEAAGQPLDAARCRSTDLPLPEVLQGQ